MSIIIINIKPWYIDNIIIREYGSTARKKNVRLYISIASDELKSLVIYTDKF